MTDPALTLTITQAGQAALAAAQLATGDAPLRVAQLGLSDSTIDVAPTLTALPGEFKRLATISGAPVGDDIVHLVMRDDDAVSYGARALGLYLTDGTLFAVYAQTDNLVEKTSQASLMAAIDVAFPIAGAEQISFGDANWINPPATTTTAGVVELATVVEARAGTDPRRVPPVSAVLAMLRAYLAPGIISYWYGSADTVPAGWAICDGRTVPLSDGSGQITTPDLRNLAAVGAGGLYRPLATFGAVEKTVTSTQAGGYTPAGTLPAHAHGVDLTAETATAETGVTFTTQSKTDIAGNGTGSAVNGITVNDPGHQHQVQITGNTAAAAELALTMEAVPAHAHDVTIDVTQPSMALYFIMRI